MKGVVLSKGGGSDLETSITAGDLARLNRERIATYCDSMVLRSMSWRLSEEALFQITLDCGDCGE